MSMPDEFRAWLQGRSEDESYFSGTFWLLFSKLPEVDFHRALELNAVSVSPIPAVARSTTSAVYMRSGNSVRATFAELPIHRDNFHVLFSLDKPAQALRPMYRLLTRTRGGVSLFPLGAPLVKACARLVPGHPLEETQVLRGVSYPTRPSYGGADINLKPGNASAFFAKLREERRVLKTAKLRAPAGKNSFCEFTVGRAGYITYHKGTLGPLLDLVAGDLPRKLSDSVRPFEKTGGRFVEFRFEEPLFVDRTNYSVVVDALSHLPRTSLALLHTNPYFHATLTNYEDGSEFDIFITGHSTISVQGREEASPASFLRIQNGLTEQFRDASVSLEEPAQFGMQDLLDGQV
jgi:hypothetical protein